MIRVEGHSREEVVTVKNSTDCSQQINFEANALLRQGLRAMSDGNSLLATAVGEILVASPLFIHFDMAGLEAKPALMFRSAFFSAMESWTAATRGKLILREKGYLESNVILSFFDDDSWNSPPDVTWTNYRRRIVYDYHLGASKLEIASRIRVSRQFVSNHWENYLMMRRVCLHEIGHVAGLADTTGSESVMNASLFRRPDEPAPPEIDAVQMLFRAANTLKSAKHDPGSSALVTWPCRGIHRSDANDDES